VRTADIGEYTVADLAELFTVSRATVYRNPLRDTATTRTRQAISPSHTFAVPATPPARLRW
jgi:DeoR/GlpR family transcriptional regulator of sugar metabolism